MAIAWKRVLTSGTDAGTPSALVGTNISGTAANLTSGKVTVSANNSTDETIFPVFVDGATGAQEVESDTGLTYNPSTGMMTAAGFTGALTGNASTATTVADNAITLAKMAGGTDGNLISYDTSGNPVAVATGSSGEVLTSAGSGNPPVFAAVGGGDLTGIDSAGGTITITDGSTATPNLEITPAQTAITSLYNSSLLIGKASGDDYISFAVSDAIQFFLAGSVVGKVKAGGELEFGSLDISGDADIDGTLEADAITLNGTALGSLYSPIAGSGSIVTVGTVSSGTWSGTALVAGKVPAITALTGYTAGAYANASSVGGSSIATVGTIGTGTWNGTAVASAYLDADTAHLSTAQTFTGAKTFSAAVVINGNLTVSGATTTTLAETVKIEDNVMVLNSGLSGSTAPSKDCGLTVERGSSTDVSLFWDESLDKWTVGHSESSNEFTQTGHLCTAFNQTYDGGQDVVNGFGYIGSFQIDGTDVYIRIS